MLQTVLLSCYACYTRRLMRLAWLWEGYAMEKNR
jgi:hypothetical protein